MKKKSSSKYLRSWKLCAKLYLVRCFFTSLLMIDFEDFILILYIWVRNLKMEVIMKNNQFRQHFASINKHLTKNTMAFVYRSTCLVHFTMLTLYLMLQTQAHQCHSEWYHCVDHEHIFVGHTLVNPKPHKYLNIIVLSLHSIPIK